MVKIVVSTLAAAIMVTVIKERTDVIDDERKEKDKKKKKRKRKKNGKNKNKIMLIDGQKSKFNF